MRLLFLVSLILVSSLSYASTIKLNYSVFYSYMKTMYKLDYQYVTTAFYLVDRQTKGLCTIKNAQMLVENNYEPILFEKEGRLLPFYSNQHRKDGGMLVVNIDDNKTLSSCDLQITVMAKQRELDDLDEYKLAIVNEQLEGVLKKNAGMIGQYFLPSFAGLRLQFTEPLNAPQIAKLGTQLNISENGQLLLKPGQFSLIDKLNELNIAVVRITPWMVNNQ